MAYIGRTPTNAALTAADLADGIVSTAKIAADAVTDAKIADDVVGTEHLTANEVDTAALGADAVTGAQLADNAVNSEHYTDGSIDTAHIADAQITTAKLATAVFTGATDIGAAIVDADLFLMDDGAGGTIRKTTAARLKTYAGVSGDVTTIDSLFKTDIKIGEDSDTRIDFETANRIHMYTDGTKRFEMLNTGKTVLTANAGSDVAFHLINSNSSNPYGMAIVFSGAADDNNSQYFLHCGDSTTDRLRIWSDGDVVNHDNSYGATSDQRIKSNIVNANSQWDDIKAVKVRNYKKNDDIEQYGNNAVTELGVIAQELEASNMSGLVKNEVLYVSTDQEVIDGDKNVGDIKHYKSVKYSILYMKAIKALQEAMTKIEDLQTRITTLEDA
tara:strand:+ start:368 stop:1528 length:1161 start_codon:yes stop_codon:yes gene_type:complete